MKQINLIVLATAGLLLTAAASDAPINTLTEAEKAAGWKLYRLA